MENDIVTVIVPVYNSEKYLEECLMSICSQSYRHLEIIVIDDGSTDGSFEICDTWAKSDARIMLIHIDNNGVSNARNIGLNKATGKYVTFVDSDDVLELDMLEKMISIMNDIHVDVIECSYCKFGDVESDNIIHDGHIDVYGKMQCIHQMFKCQYPNSLTWSIGGKLFHRAAISGLEFSLNIFMGEDKLFMWQTLQNVKKYGYVDSAFYHYRIHSLSVTQNKLSPKVLSGYFANEKIMMSARKLGTEYEKSFYRQYVFTLVGYLLKMLLLSPEEYREIICLKQSYLRKNIIDVLNCNCYSYKFKLATVFMLFPYCVIKIIMKFFKNNKFISRHIFA